MGAQDGRDRPYCGDDERVMISLPAHIRSRPTRGSLRRLLYRAEPARDWEPRLDELWERANYSYPVAVVRDADRALRQFAGHPTIRHHRFLVLPRFSDSAVAFAVFVDDDADCCWLDLVWDHGHPGALELLTHISGRLAAQWGSQRESLRLTGDTAASAVLQRRGFRIQEVDSCAVDWSVFSGRLDGENTFDRAYLTAADLGEIDP
jgi:hypothetical protein